MHLAVDPSSQRHFHRRTHHRILFADGFWWLVYPDQDSSFRLDQTFDKCNWKIGHLCDFLGIGQRTFSRMVEEDLGINAKLWLRQIRIVAATHLLREECKICSIASDLGFNYPSDFDREFKKLVGVSPTHYRQCEHSRAFIPR